MNAWSGIVGKNEPKACRSFPVQQRMHKDFYSNASSITYVFDLCAMKYLFMSKNVADYTGYSADEFLYKGPFFTLSLIHPEDRTVLLQQVQRTQIKFINDLQEEDYKNYRFSYTYRFKRADGEYIQILQQESVCHAAGSNHPLSIVGNASDITFLKKDPHICLSIAKIGTGLSKVMHAIPPLSGVLSGREAEVLKLIIAGKNTNQIGETLKISPNTVKNHRRRMIEKTEACNMAEVIRIAYSEGLL